MSGASTAARCLRLMLLCLHELALKGVLALLLHTSIQRREGPLGFVEVALDLPSE